jgi:hypothetical protein
MANIEKMTIELNKLKNKRLLKSEFKEALRKIYANTYFYKAVRESGFVVEDNDNNAYYITQSEPIYRGKVEVLYNQAYNCSRHNYNKFRTKESNPQPIVEEVEQKVKAFNREAEAIAFLKSRGYLIYKAC